MSHPLPKSRKLTPTAVFAVCTIATLSLLAACQRDEGAPTVGQKIDGTIAKTEQATADARASATASAESAKTALKDGVEQTKMAAQQANAKLDRTIEDAAMTASISAGFMKDPDLSALKIDVDSQDGIVSLFGRAPNEAARSRASNIAMAVKGVTAVQNRLIVKPSP